MLWSFFFFICCIWRSSVFVISLNDDLLAYVLIVCSSQAEQRNKARLYAESWAMADFAKRTLLKDGPLFMVTLI